MNYYIQGNKDKAEEIKAAFQELGINVLDFGFADRAVVYCSIGECVQYLPYSINLMNILYSHPAYMELELPVEPKFNVGDKIRSKSTQMTYTIIKIDVVNGRYELDYCSVMDFKEQNKFELVPTHYDIANFKPFDKVLIRFGNNDPWRADFFSHIKEDRGRYFVGVGYANRQCIPFEGNEHLLGTTDMCPEEYVNW